MGWPSVKQDSRYLRTSGWELCGSRAMSGLSEEPGRRYSGGAPSWLVVSVFVLLKERFRLFPLGKLESAPAKKGDFSTSLINLVNFVYLYYYPFGKVHSMCAYLVFVYVWASPVRSVSVLLSVHPEVQTISAVPAHEPDGAGRSRRCRVLERHTA